MEVYNNFIIILIYNNECCIILWLYVFNIDSLCNQYIKVYILFDLLFKSKYICNEYILKYFFNNGYNIYLLFYKLHLNMITHWT